MFEIGDRVKIVSVGEGVSNEYLDKIGVVAEISDKDCYKCKVQFDDLLLEDETSYLWWIKENLEFVASEDINEDNFKNCNCIRCGSKMHYLKEYKLNDGNNHKDILSDKVDDKEEHLFKVFICPKCRHTEIFFVGDKEGIPEWEDWK